jgi:hypothetical protein
LLSSHEFHLSPDLNCSPRCHIGHFSRCNHWMIRFCCCAIKSASLTFTARPDLHHDEPDVWLGSGLCENAAAKAVNLRTSISFPVCPGKQTSPSR